MKCSQFAAVWLCAALSIGTSAAPAVPTPSTAPTADTLTARQIDDIWRKSVSKFDGERARVLKRVRSGVQGGPFGADWASLQNYKEPAWYADAKFGIFVHWGVFSVPAFGSEWYSREMYLQDNANAAHHRATFGPQDRFGYKDLIPRFKGEHFDPDGWAQLFQDAGARYVVPVAEHHDGFAMYRSKLSDWTAATMGPKRDVVGELATAIKAHGMHFGASSHRAEHDWFFDGGRHFASDVNDPKFAAFYGPAHLRNTNGDDADVAHDWTYASQAWLDDWLARTAELVDSYHPELLYFDWWIGHPTFRNALAEFAAYYYNQGMRSGRGAVLIYKLNGMPEGAGTFDVERGALPGIHPLHWQTDTSISNQSWGYVDGDTYKPASELLHQLIDVVAKNGNLMLNVGPRADGTLPDEARNILLQMGAWLKVNGEAIYGTRPWAVFGEGPTDPPSGTFKDRDAKPYTADDFRFTRSGRNVYAIQLGTPANREVVIHSVTAERLQAATLQVTLVATGEAVPASLEADGLHLHLTRIPPTELATTYRITLP